MWSITKGERSNQLGLERIMKVAEQEQRRLKSEYFEDAEQRWGYEGMEVG